MNRFWIIQLITIVLASCTADPVEKNGVKSQIPDILESDVDRYDNHQFEEYALDILSFLHENGPDNINSLYADCKYYLTAIKSSKPTIPEDQYNYYHDTCPSRLKATIIQSMANLSSGDMDWKNSVMDSITYSFISPEVIINWPDSKNHNLKTSNLLEFIFHIEIHFKNNNSDYKIVVNACDYNDGLFLNMDNEILLIKKTKPNN